MSTEEVSGNEFIGGLLIFGNLRMETLYLTSRSSSFVRLPRLIKVILKFWHIYPCCILSSLDSLSVPINSKDSG